MLTSTQGPDQHTSSKHPPLKLHRQLDRQMFLPPEFEKIKNKNKRQPLPEAKTVSLT